MKNVTPAGSALMMICAGFVAHAVWLECVAEDAYITFRFARNVVEGHGYVWNVGGQLCVVALTFGLDVARLTQVVGVAAGIATLLVSWLFARRILGLNPKSALFTVAMLAAAGPLAAWASSGMETAFFTWCITFAVYCSARFLVTARNRDGLLMATALVAATLTRPEGFGIAAIVLPATYWLSQNTTARRRTVAVAGAYLTVFGVYVVWRYTTFGYPLPNTFYAKTGGGWHQYWRGSRYVIYFALHYVWPWIPWIVLFAWRSADRLSFAGVARHTRGLASSESAGLVLAAAVTAGYLGYVVLVGGDYMAMYRFIVPVLPTIFLLLGYCTDQAVRGVHMTVARRIVVAVMAGTTASGVFLQSTRYEQAVFAPVPQMHGTYRGIGTERWHINRFHVIAKFFTELRPDYRASILTYDLGVVGYATRFTIHDALGIVDPVIAHSPAAESMGQGLAGHEKQDLRYSYSLMPTFVMYTVELRATPADWPRYSPDLDTRVRAEYELSSVWLTDTANQEAGYFTYLERKP
jgi:arabinofuranosyltransferase